MKHNRVRVWQHPTGIYCWECNAVQCGAHANARDGASIFWEIAQRQADDHAREWHHPPVPHDMPTPPGGTHYDWSDTGMHLRIRGE